MIYAVSSLRKIFWILPFIFLTQVKTVYAVPSIPSPTCEVEGSIISLKPEVKIKIISLLSESGDTEFTKCADLHSVEKEEIIELISKDSPKLEIGMKIKVTLHYAGDEHSQGMYASNITVVERTSNQFKTSNWWENFLLKIINFVIGKKG